MQQEDSFVPRDDSVDPARPELCLESLWHEIQGALLRNIPREQFETWFRRARLVGANDESVQIAFQNKFALTWVEGNFRNVVELAVGAVFPTRREVQFTVDPEIALRPPPQGLDPASHGIDSNGHEPQPPLHSGRPAAPDFGSAARQPGERHVLQPQPPPPVPGGSPNAPHASHANGASNAFGNGNNHVSSSLPPLPGSAPPHGGAAPNYRRTRGGVLDDSDVSLNARYNFESFVVGPCNRLAHAAAVGVSERPGTLYNPFFLHGGVGYGKTHLLQSLCHALLERDQDVRILYLSCETFVNHFIAALGNGDLQKFRNKYRNVDVLVVDDIHMLANKERTQEEFFHTFNTLYNAGKQIVISSDSPPKDIPTLQERLVSRFKWGLVTEIEKPSYETRMAILKRKSRDRGTEIPDDVARVLAERIDSNIRELEGAVTKLTGYAGICGRAIDVDLAKECLRDVFVAQRGQVTMEDILRLITEHFGVKLSELQSKKRTNAIAYPRQIGMYLARKVTRMSLEEIGGYFGGRDHSTVLYAVRKMEKLSSEDPSVGDSLRELETALRSPGL